MKYVVVTKKDTIVSRPFASFAAAFAEAERLFGDDALRWLDLNVRVEQPEQSLHSMQVAH